MMDRKEDARADEISNRLSRRRNGKAKSDEKTAEIDAEFVLSDLQLTSFIRSVFLHPHAVYFVGAEWDDSCFAVVVDLYFHSI